MVLQSFKSGCVWKPGSGHIMIEAHIGRVHMSSLMFWGNEVKAT